jgi:SAM-dependent methyltransferase
MSSWVSATRVLGDEMRPPFAVNSLSRVVMLHALEHAVAADELLRVTWQLLAPGGQLLLIVPNRRGLWSRYGATPFSTGTPYALATLKTLLGEVDFTLRDVSTALFALIIEAEKQIYAGVGERKLHKVKAPAWSGVAA